MSWESRNKNLGVVKAGNLYKISFVYNGVIDVDVKSIHSPCSCTAVEWDKNKNTLNITYKPKPVPRHLRELKMTNYNDVKEITFNATIDNVVSQQILSITAQIFD